MNRKSPFWLIGIASLLFIGLVTSQVIWIYASASEQEEQFNKKIDLALTSIEDNIIEDTDLCYSVGCCLIEGMSESCAPSMNKDAAWQRTDSMISAELQRYEIDLNYNFDFCFKDADGEKTFESYEQNMDKVFDKSGIVLFLEFPDKSKYLMNQIGPVFISSILLIVFLSIVFVLTYRFYKRERDYAQRTRDFINNMTHEFNTPLTNISLANSMMARGLESKDIEKLLHYSSIIDDESQRLAKNCDDLLQMAKIENAQITFTDSLDVHAIIQKVIDNKKPLAGERNVEITCELKAEGFMVLGRESLFYNTISNLIDNAIKYSKKSADILVKTVNKDGSIHISIQDKGIGIKAEDVPHIFDKFYRVSVGDAHDVKGFGLGLAYVKMVITKMKGRIKVDSKLGSGSTFNITLPIAKAS